MTKKPPMKIVSQGWFDNTRWFRTASPSGFRVGDTIVDADGLRAVVREVVDVAVLRQDEIRVEKTGETQFVAPVVKE